MKQMTRSWDGCPGSRHIGTFCLSDAEQAIVRYRKAVERARMYRERAAEGTALMHLGDAYLHIGEIECAIECYHEQLAIARELGHRCDEGVALNNLGNAYANLRNRRRAIRYYRDYLALALALGDERAQAIANWNIGMVYREKGNLAQAVAFVREGVEVMRRMNHSETEQYAMCLQHLMAQLAESQMSIWSRLQQWWRHACHVRIVMS